MKQTIGFKDGFKAGLGVITAQAVVGLGVIILISGICYLFS